MKLNKNNKKIKTEMEMEMEMAMEMVTRIKMEPQQAIKVFWPN
jgi:hypothetical protein